MKESNLPSGNYVRRPQPKDRRIREALGILQSHPDLTIAELASKEGLSPSGLHHLAKRELGTSLLAYILETRLQEAFRRLVETDDLIKVISHDCGFPDPSNFCHKIRNRFGKSPTDLRKAGVTATTNRSNSASKASVRSDSSKQISTTRH
jgi:AraC-like DNA-binding protein